MPHKTQLTDEPVYTTAGADISKSRDRWNIDIEPTPPDIKKMSQAGLSGGEKGAAAGRKLREQMIKMGTAAEKSNQEICKLGITINMSIPHNPGRIKRFFRWILAKIRGDIPTSYTDSRGNIYRGWAKCRQFKTHEFKPGNIEGLHTALREDPIKTLTDREKELKMRMP